MNEKQCVRCGRVGHNIAECKWLEVMSADQALRDEMFKSEMAAWRFYQDGKWRNGDDRIKDHRKNTEDAGIPTRDLYAQPPAVAVPSNQQRTNWQLLVSMYESGTPAQQKGAAGMAIDALRRLVAAAPQVATSAGLHLNPTQVAALREVLRISDRQHDAWDTLKAALKGNQ